MSWIQQAGLQALIADGVTAEGRVVVPKAILEIIQNNHLATVAVNAGGTGYVVGEEFDIVGGTAAAVNGRSFIARGRVTAEAGGVVSGVELLSAGAYTVDPGLSGLATANATLGGNDDLTVDVTIQTAYWTEDSSDYTDLLTLFEWLCTSTKVSNAPTIGMRSQLSGANDGIRLQVATSYDSGSAWIAQPGSPPSNLFFMAVPNQDPQIYISTTERRVNVLITDGTFKQYGGVGLFIPFTDVDANYPFPGIVYSQSTSVQAFNTSFSSSNRGIVHPIDASALGAYQYRNNLSTEWFGITHDNGIGTQVPRALIWPAQGNEAEYSFQFAPVPTGSGAGSASMDPWLSSMEVGSFADETVQGWYHTSAAVVNAQGPAPLGVGNQLHFTTQAHLISNLVNDVQMVGIVDGYEAVHGRGLNAFDEIRTESGRRYLVFNDTNTGSIFRWTAMEKL